jgi:hypothetical protein
VKVWIYSFALITAVAAIINAGCGTNSGGGCTIAILRPAPPVLVYPSPSATAVSTSIGKLLFSSYVTSDVVTLTTLAGAPVVAATMVPAAAPLPSSLPTPAGHVYGEISIPILSSTTTYAVVNTQTFSGPCGGTETSAVQSFTTQ